MKKTAKEMSDAELNVQLYRKIMALDQSERKKLSDYWTSIFGAYGVEMVTDKNESAQKGEPASTRQEREKPNKTKKKKPYRPNSKFPEDFKS